MRILLALLAAGCAERALPLPDALITVEEYREAYPRVRCERLARCGFLDDSQYQKCLEYVADELANSGQQRFDGAAAATCLGRIESLDCKAYRDVFCPQVFVGTRSDGEICTQDCAPGLTCNTTMCPPRCQPAPPAAPKKPRGAACTDGADECEPGLVCAPGRGCQPPGQLGDACYNTHVPYLACVEGLVCQDGYPVGKCVPFRKAGEPCTLINGCDDGLLCVEWHAPDVPGVCKAPIAEGQPCQPLEECRFYTVCLGGVCTAPAVKLGETCAESFDNCATGYCDRATRICLPPIAEGASCDPAGSYRQCRNGSCSAATATCVRCP
jgi:hypothetical protein